ncbi:hypothetical protein ACHAWF_002258 [Thalassiosira exigua]
MPYQLSSGAIGEHHHQPSQPARGDVKSKSHLQTKAQWKEKLRRGCVERAKVARRERLQKSRLNNHGSGEGYLNGPTRDCAGDISATSDKVDGHGKTMSVKRGRDESHPDWKLSGGVVVDRTPTPVDSWDRVCRESGDSEENAVNAARALVEQELQRAMIGMQHCHQVRPLDGGTPWKKTQRQEQEFERDFDAMDSCLMEQRSNPAADEYKISEEEFAELLNAVTEELEREGAHSFNNESLPCSISFAFLFSYGMRTKSSATYPPVDELLEEEIWELERAQAMERERLMHQIDDFESWEECQHQPQQSNTYVSPMASDNSPLVTCPVCNVSSLMETPHGGIQCTSFKGTGASCTFQLDIAHEGLTLVHLQQMLRDVYEEHSQVCASGILQFCVENKAGMSILMARCDVCSSDVVVL